MILVDLDGTLVPYANEHNHVYRCECGNEFKPCNLDLELPVSCSSCGGTSFKRDKPIGTFNILSISFLAITGATSQTAPDPI
jgi:hypothetical protein